MICVDSTIETKDHVEEEDRDHVRRVRLDNKTKHKEEQQVHRCMRRHSADPPPRPIEQAAKKAEAKKAEDAWTVSSPWDQYAVLLMGYRKPFWSMSPF